MSMDEADFRDPSYESSCCGMPPLGGVDKIREGSYMGFCSACKEATEFYHAAEEEAE